MSDTSAATDLQRRAKLAEARRKQREDKDFAFLEQKKKVLRRIKDGNIPRRATMEKYAITLEQVNKARASSHLPPLDESYLSMIPVVDIDRANVVLGMIDKENERLNNIRELERFGAQTMREVNDRIHDVQSTQDKIVSTSVDNNIEFDYSKLRLLDIIAYFDALVASGKLNFQTIYSYKSKWYNTFKLVGAKVNSDLIPFINDYKTVISKLKEKYTNVSTYKGMVQGVFYLINNYPKLLQKINNEAVVAYTQEFQKAKTTAAAKQASKPADESLAVPHFDDIKKRILEFYPKNSREHLLIELYDQALGRDNYGDVLLIKDESEATEKDQDYLIFTKDPVIILRTFKTVERYGENKEKLKRNIYYILKAQGKKPGDLMISKDDGSKFGINGALSHFIASMLKKAGIDTKGGGINLLRKSKISQLLPNATLEDREIIARMAGHSPAMSTQYLRKHKDQLLMDGIAEKEQDEIPLTKRTAKRQAKGRSK
jgi:hypothetical protein